MEEYPLGDVNPLKGSQYLEELVSTVGRREYSYSPKKDTLWREFQTLRNPRCLPRVSRHVGSKVCIHSYHFAKNKLRGWAKKLGRVDKENPFL